MPVRVLIVDDHARFRATVRRSLECEGWTVVGEAADGRSGLDATRDLDPELVLLDIGLPDMSGLEVAGVLRDTAPDVRVVLISTHDEADYHELALSHGARGFLSKAELSGDALDSLLAGR